MFGWLRRVLGSAKEPTDQRLVVVSAPSGAGKTSLVKAVLEREPGIAMAVSYTTRPRRANETDGVDYHFVERGEFDRLAESGALLEWASVFDNAYGTGRQQVEELLANGSNVVLEIDWQGARQVRKRMPEAISVFILPPSRPELERRLRGRGTDSDEVIERRLRDSVADMSHWAEFDFVIVNDEFDDAARALAEVIAGGGLACRRERPGLAGLVEGIMQGSGGPG